MEGRGEYTHLLKPAKCNERRNRVESSRYEPKMVLERNERSFDSGPAATRHLDAVVKCGGDWQLLLK